MIRPLLLAALALCASDALAQRRGGPMRPPPRQQMMPARALPPRPLVERDGFVPRRGGEAMAVREARREGRMLSARDIERRVVPTVPRAQYLGFDYDGAAVYTLKFVRDGAVIWVDVDARTGAVLGRTGR